MVCACQEWKAPHYHLQFFEVVIAKEFMMYAHRYSKTSGYSLIGEEIK